MFKISKHALVSAGFWIKEARVSPGLVTRYSAYRGGYQSFTRLPHSAFVQVIINCILTKKMFWFFNEFFYAYQRILHKDEHIRII